MPKPLSKPQPSSSVANLLDPGVGKAATGNVAAFPRVPDRPHAGLPSQAEPTGEPANIKREFVLTASADEVLKELVSLYEKATGTNLTNSHLLRAVLTALSQALPEFRKEAARL